MELPAFSGAVSETDKTGICRLCQRRNGYFAAFPVAERLSLVIENIRLIQSAISIQSAYIQVLLKIIGITYISEFAADICRDAGCAAVAGQIGVFAKLSILAVSMPIVSALLQTIQSFLGG